MALNPHQKNKVDINALTEEEQKLFRLYGKLPNKKDLFSKKLQERKYFDSGDYALSKAGKSNEGVLGGGLGRQHPSPESIPHLSPQQSASVPSNNIATGELRGSLPTLQPTVSNSGHSGSPVKESSILQRGTSVDEQDAEEKIPDPSTLASSPPSRATLEKGMPIRQ